MAVRRKKNTELCVCVCVCVRERERELRKLLLFGWLGMMSEKIAFGQQEHHINDPEELKA